ncbi:MAG: DUF6583 family protein [Clostridia bacterium]|jgi:hypothetical protein|nr:DUF6583 family protein [Clostridia bacterium]CDC05667.1 unknown [Clostridium sp. CAG:343]
MMPRKKRIALAIAIPSIIVIIIIITGILLYLNTDMFKSNKTLFFKYFGKNSENIKEIEEIFESTEYEKNLQNNKYTDDINIKVNYTNNLQTTSEDNSNTINNVKLLIKGEEDKNNKYSYKDFKLEKDKNIATNTENQSSSENSNESNNKEQNIMEVEYIKNDNNYGIRFSDLFKQYLLVENNNLKDLFRKIGYSEQELENVPDSIEINDITLSDIKFTEDEIKQLSEKYSEIINKKVSKEKFEKNSKQVITINEKNITTNAYILKLTNEELNNLYVDLLESLKQDEIILNKIESIQNKINSININSSESKDLKESFAEEIDLQIEKINKTNIGNQETKIIVYENSGKTIRTAIQGKDYEINFDYINTQDEKNIELIVKKDEIETYNIKLKKDKDGIKLDIYSNDETNPIKISLEQNKNESDKKCSNNINLKYENANSKLEVSAEQEINIVDNFENENTLNDQNSILLNGLEKEQLQAVLNQVSEEVQQKINSISEEVKINDIQEILETLGIINKQQNIEAGGITETEKNRFNSKFEILKGEELDNENVLKVVEAVKDNIINAQVDTNEEIKIEISRNESNQDIEKSLEEYIKKEKDKKYDIKIEYDENTELVKYIIMTPAKKR